MYRNLNHGKSVELLEKGVDVKLAVRAAELIILGEFNRIIIVSADGDFYPVAELARKYNLECIIDFPGKISSLYKKIPWVKIARFQLNSINASKVCD